LIASGCRAEVSVRLDIGRDGSSTVAVALSVDDEISLASKKITGRSLVSMLDIEPLTSTGWAVESASIPNGTTIRPAESLVITRNLGRPSDLSPTMSVFVAGGTTLFETLDLRVRDEPHRISYVLSGAIRLPPIDALLPPIPSALSEVLSSASSNGSEPPLKLILNVHAPGKVVDHNADTAGDEYIWKVFPGEQREIALESEIVKTRRIALWSASVALVAVSVVFYIAARRRSASTFFRT
jgi:hypothetical protein